MRAVLEAEPAVAAAARAALTVVDPAAQHTWSVKNGRSDGSVCFMRRGPAGDEFLSGLTWRVATAIRDAGLGRPTIAWPAVEQRRPLADAVIGMEWRPYQLTGVEKMMRVRRLCVQCPPRTGKTEMGIEFMRQVGGRALWVTHLDELKRQTPQRIRERLGIEVTVVGDDDSPDPDAAVTVGMVQTISKWARPTLKRGRRVVTNPDYDPKWFEQFDCLVMDEAHHAGAETWQAVAAACTKAAWRLGLSGTMRTGNVKADLLIEGALGPTYVVADTAELADQGFLAKPQVVFHRVPPTTYPSYEEVRERVVPDWRDDPRGLISKAGGRMFRDAYERGVAENDARNKVVIDVAREAVAAGEKFLVLCNRVGHAAALHAALSRRLDRGRAWFLSGDDGSDERKQVLALYKAIEGGAVLICTPFFREGVDLPQVDSGFMAGGGESDIAVWQGFCRMLTVREGKMEATVHDFIDGRDQAHLKDYLANHYKSRRSLYERHGCKII